MSSLVTLEDKQKTINAATLQSLKLLIKSNQSNVRSHLKDLGYLFILASEMHVASKMYLNGPRRSKAITGETCIT